MTFIYHGLRFIYITMLIFAAIQYLCKCFCLIHALKEHYQNTMDDNVTIIFLLLGEFWCFGYLIFYVRGKDHNRFIVRLYRQKFVYRVLDACHVSSAYLDAKTLDDVKGLCKFYEEKRMVFGILEERFGYDVSIVIMKYVCDEWELRMKIFRGNKEQIQTNICPNQASSCANSKFESKTYIFQ